MKYPLIAAALFFQATAAHALQHPQPAVPLTKGGDPHVQVANFDPTQPVLVVGAIGRPVTISFGPEESVVRINLETSAIIDGKEAPAPWQGPDATLLASQPLGNVLPLWVMRAGRSSGQVITKTPDGTYRVYQLHMISLPAQPNECDQDDCDDPRITSGLSFIYPPEKKPQVEQAVIQTRLAAQKLAAEARLKTDIFYGVRNWKYDVKGDPAAIKDIAPDQMSDNTQVTGLLYRGNRQAPSIYVVEADNSERQINPTLANDLLIVSEAAAHWRLRKGTQVVDIFNRGYDAIGANPYTGTTSPNVIRVTRTTPVGQK